MLSWLRPHDNLRTQDVRRGLGVLLYDGTCSQVMGVLTGGAFLVAFALLLGASNTVIGLLASVGPLAQILQIPAIFVVDKTRLRKFLAVASIWLSRLTWIGIVALPWVVPVRYRMPAFLVCLFAYFGFGALGTCAFNSWMRDLIPEKLMGRFFAKRMTVAVAVGAVVSLAGGVAVDWYKDYYPNQNEILIYCVLFGVGTLVGMVGVGFLSAVPEPQMPVVPGRSVLAVLSEPFHDRNFRELLRFLGILNFAISFAGPFFTVYMIQRLHLSMTWILGLALLSQFFNVLFFRVWGRLADRFSNKSVLGVSGFQFLATFLIWPFTTMPERYWLTLPLLVVIHVLGGISTAGVGLCAGNIALKAAPKGKATSYLAVNALVCGLAATVAPILAGFAADQFQQQELKVTIAWTSAVDISPFLLPAMDIKGLDFIFITAFVFGVYALHRLLAVKEEGEVQEEVVVQELYSEVRRTMQNLSSVAGMRHLTYFPYYMVKTVRERIRVNAQRKRAGMAPTPNEFE